MAGEAGSKDPSARPAALLRSDPKAALPAHFFVHLVVRRGERFLIIQENKPGFPWYLPAGRVERGESWLAAAHRETLEEAGIPIVVEGVVRLEHLPSRDGDTRVRLILAARPADDTPPKSAPDTHSLGARWVRLAELDDLDLRHREVRDILAYVAAGAPIAPIDLIHREGDAYDAPRVDTPEPKAHLADGSDPEPAT
jgi:phosphatase NudJ